MSKKVGAILPERSRSTPFRNLNLKMRVLSKLGNLVLVPCRPQGFNCMVKCTKPAEQALCCERWSDRVQEPESSSPEQFLVAKAKKSPENSVKKKVALNSADILGFSRRLKAQKVSMRLKWVMNMVSSLSSDRKWCPAFKLLPASSFVKSTNPFPSFFHLFSFVGSFSFKNL